MSKQPEALRLADMIDRYNSGVMSQRIVEDYQSAINELRRLHASNVELAEALQACVDSGSMTGADWVTDKAIAAIAKHGGQQ